MPLSERLYGVWLHATYVGTLRQRGDHVRFEVHPSYADDPERPVLGLLFEQDLSRVHSASLRLPPWFSNLLPEGVQRGWIAEQRGVPAEREMELLAQVGRDLPGAVTVRTLPPGAIANEAPDPPPPAAPAVEGSAASSPDPRGRFSLAGVQLKMSMVVAGDRLVLPLGGALGDWIVKFPDASFAHLPVVEFATMELARCAGINVPPTRLVSRAELPDTPDSLWTNDEEAAFAIERFDRAVGGSLLHIEDFAQVRGVWAHQKYEGSYEGLAALVHRGYDADSLYELVRRLAFNALVDNSDAHLKNFSLLYRDPRRPVLSPAYDLVSVAPYDGYGGQTALTVDGTRRIDRLRLRSLGRLGRRLGVPEAELSSAADATLTGALSGWEEVADAHLRAHPRVWRAMGAVLSARAASLRS